MIQATRKITKCEAESSLARLIDILQKNQARVKATLPFLFTSYFKYHNQTKNIQSDAFVFQLKLQYYHTDYVFYPLKISNQTVPGESIYPAFISLKHIEQKGGQECNNHNK